jgi:hypothetical protein
VDAPTIEQDTNIPAKPMKALRPRGRLLRNAPGLYNLIPALFYSALDLLKPATNSTVVTILWAKAKSFTNSR